MADERDPQISQRYRELGKEEPPPELDRAILAASRRATSRYRWYSSLAAAAVLIFAVALVVQIERQPPDQVLMSAPSTPVAAPPSDKQEPEAPAAKPAPRRRAEPAPQLAPAPAPEPNANVAVPAAGTAAEEERKRVDEIRAGPQAQRSMAARSAADVQANLVETPDQWLARIARMRELGQDEQADKELARFRERYPDYRIPEAMAKKVEKQAPAAPAR
jgi:hypothetical protein